MLGFGLELTSELELGLCLDNSNSWLATGFDLCNFISISGPVI